MDNKLLDILVRFEVKKLIKDGMSPKEAIEQGAENVKEAVGRAEFIAYCSEHNC